jgi:hypothetical protein
MFSLRLRVWAPRRSAGLSDQRGDLAHHAGDRRHPVGSRCHRLDGGADLVEALGSGVTSTIGVVQAGGTAWFVPAQVCRDLNEKSSRFRRAASLAAELQALEARQSTLCRSYHLMPVRLSRWLLEMRDKSGADGDRLKLTHEFMAAMLGVQRTTVSTVAHDMQAKGLIRYSRGLIEINDADRLEAQACTCRAEVRNHIAASSRLSQIAAKAIEPNGAVLVRTLCRGLGHDHIRQHVRERQEGRRSALHRKWLGRAPHRLVEG